MIDDKQQKIPQATIVAVPAKREREDLYQTATSDQNGSFEMRGLAPGEYRVYAWREIEPQAWLDPEVLKQAEPNSTPLKLTASQRATVQLVLSAQTQAAK